MYPAPADYLQLPSNHTTEEVGDQHLTLQRVRDLSAATRRQKELGYKGKNGDAWWVTEQRHECLLTQIRKVFKEGGKSEIIISGTKWIV